MREKSPTVRPAVTRPLSTLPVPEGQSMNSHLTLRAGERRGWSYHQDGDTQEQLPRRSKVMTATSALDTVLAEHVAAVNAFDEDAIVATFADDALVNDAHREFWGIEAIRRWVAKEMVGDHVTIDVTRSEEHYGDTIVRGRYDGDFDKTNLPGDLILTNYFTVRDGKIVSLIVIRNRSEE